MSTTALYDAFSADYDQFVNWDERLAYELPFVVGQLRGSGAKRVLDVACGTGRHAIALAREGFQVSATDLSEAMVRRARENVATTGVSVQVWAAGFGELAQGLQQRQAEQFDALVCLGNSIPHVLTMRDLEATLSDMASVLNLGGVLLLQQRNFDKVLANGQRYMPPQSHRDRDAEWLFLRFYDFEDDGSLGFNVVRLSRHVGQPWESVLGRTHLYPWRHDELVGVLQRTGFEVSVFGNLAGEPYEKGSSDDLVVRAVRI